MIWELQTVTGTQNVWKQERYVVHDNVFDGWRFYTDLHGSAAAPIATYTGGEAYIDVTDYLRTYPTVSKLNFADNLDPSIVITINVSVVGLINPEGVIIPDQPLAAYGALVIPPSYMICALDGNNLEDAELYTNTGTWAVSGGASKSVNGRNIGQISGAFTLSDGTHSKIYTPKTFRCGIRYALVQWVSFSGATRAHWLEVFKVKTTTKDSYSLMPLDNEYIDIKGREDGFTLRLEGLDAYDLWYYADMIHSSKVEISLDGTTFDRVQVTTSNMTYPDGEAGTDGKLEITVNWKKYDAVAM